jgi:hypothetical protein
MGRDLLVDFVGEVFGVNSNHVYFQGLEFDKLLGTPPFLQLIQQREETLRLLLEATNKNDLKSFQIILNSVRPQLAYEVMAALACCELAGANRPQNTQIDGRSQ